MKNKCIVKKRSFKKMLFENPAPLNMRLRMQLRSFTVDKMAGIFAKPIGQHYSGPLRSAREFGENFCFLQSFKI